MAFIQSDRVKESATTTGTGSFTLAGAASGFKTFASRCSVSDTFYYAIVNASVGEWEVGYGTYSGANTLARTTVLRSSNSDAAVSFSAGTKDVYITLPGDRTLTVGSDGTLLGQTRLIVANLAEPVGVDVFQANAQYATADAGNGRVLVSLGLSDNTTTGTQASQTLVSASVSQNGATDLQEYRGFDINYGHGATSILQRGSNYRSEASVQGTLNDVFAHFRAASNATLPTFTGSGKIAGVYIEDLDTSHTSEFVFGLYVAFSRSFFGGGMIFPIVTAGGGGYALTGNDHTILADGTSGDVTYDLTPASVIPVPVDGQEFIFVRTDNTPTTRVILDAGSGGVLIGTSRYYYLDGQDDSVTLRYYGGHYRIVAENRDILGNADYSYLIQNVI